MPVYPIYAIKGTSPAALGLPWGAPEGPGLIAGLTSIPVLFSISLCTLAFTPTRRLGLTGRAAAGLVAFGTLLLFFVVPVHDFPAVGTAQLHRAFLSQFVFGKSDGFPAVGALQFQELLLVFSLEHVFF